MAKVRHQRFDCSPGCAVEAAIGLIDGKWKSVILFHLLSGTLRFSEIRRHIVNITPRMLTNQLRELEEDGLITRRIYAQVPPKVEYSLSPLGHTMEPILLALKMWGDSHIGLYGKPNGFATQERTPADAMEPGPIRGRHPSFGQRPARQARPPGRSSVTQPKRILATHSGPARRGDAGDRTQRKGNGSVSPNAGRIGAAAERRSERA